jgi:hypothetical protein
MPTRTRPVPGATPCRIVLVAAFMSAQTARADLVRDLDKLRAAHEAFVTRYTGSTEQTRDLPPAPSAWGQDGQSCRDPWSVVGAFLKVADKAYDDSRDWSGAAAFGFSSDNAGNSEKTRGAMEARFEAGQYPDQFRLEAGASMDFDNQRDEELNEDVTRILLNYDHYFTPGSEGFGFIERFTDTFMSIDQRYEMGIGLKREWKDRQQSPTGKRKEAADARNKIVETARALKAELDRERNAPPAERCLVDKDWKPLDSPAGFDGKASDNPLYRFRDREAAWFEIGISAAVMADFEQADTLSFTTQIGTDPPVQQSFKADGTVRYRLSIRPSFTWHVNDELSLEGKFFYKPALDSPVSVNGVDDYRLDAQAAVRWKFGSIKEGSSKTTSLVLRYDYHYDSIPPNATSFLETLGVPLDQIVVTGRTVAEKRHYQVRMLLEIGL